MPVGTLVVPNESDVRFGIGYGADGTEFTGTLGAFVPPGSAGGNAGAVLLSLLQQQNFDGISGTDVVARKLPRVGEQLAPQPPCCILARAENAGSWEPISTEGVVERIHAFDIVFVKAGNLDMSEDDQVQTWVQQAEEAIGGDAGQSAVNIAEPKVFWMELQTWPAYDRGALAQNYSYAGVTVLVHVAKRR